MHVIIIEDEIPAANRLEKLLALQPFPIQVLQKIDSIESAVHYFGSNPNYDLIFMDIQLADGLSFSIFEKVSITKPIIFTTAFNEYAIEAFKVNSIDYLLKPIDEQQLEAALTKYKNFYESKPADFSKKVADLVRELNHQQYKERILIKRGQQLSFLKVENLAYAFADGKICYAVDKNNNKYLIETNLAQLEEQLAPNKFFRINRHLIVSIDAIAKIHTWLGGRLKVEITPTANVDSIVSRERVNAFKDWLNK